MRSRNGSELFAAGSLILPQVIAATQLLSIHAPPRVAARL
jgi:hypothetical protein